MPRDGSGNYTLPAGNPVVDATIITPSWANPTLSDIALQLNNVITRDGLLGPVTPFKFVDGSEALPGIAFNSQSNMGFYREAANVMGISIGGTVVAKLMNDAIQFLKPVNFSSGNPVPAGSVLDFAGTVAPTGFLICDGSAVSRVTYAALFAAIGTTWGAGDGTNTFNLPDLRRKATVGAGGAGTGVLGNAVGNSGGEETHSLTAAEMPTHSHGVNDPSHSHSVNDPTHAHSVYDPGHSHGVSDPGHAHAVYGGESGSYQQGGAYGASNLNNGQNRGSTFGAGTGISISGAGSNIGIYGAGTGVSIYASGTGVSVQNAGGGAVHNVIQPSAVMNKIIKT